MKRRALVIGSVIALGCLIWLLRSGVVAAAPGVAALRPPSPSESSPQVVLARVPAGGIQPEIVLDDQGVLHMVYFAGEAGAGDLFYVRSADFGATFTAPARVNSREGSVVATGTIRGGHMALGGGRVHVAWMGSAVALPRGPDHPRLSQPSAPMLYARSNEPGTGFEPQRNLVEHSYGLDGGAIAADVAGNVYVAWHGLQLGGPDGEGDRAVLVARSRDAGETFSAEEPAWNEPTGACACCGLGLFAAPGGDLYALYRSATKTVHRDMYLLRSTDAARSFRGARIHEWELAACPMSSMAMTASPDGILAAWETAGQVWFGAVEPEGPGVPGASAAPSAGTNRKHPRLAVGESGEVLLVWTEGTAWMRGGDLAWQRYDADLQPLGEMQRRPGLPVWSFGTPMARGDGSFVIFY
jgi:hypothetical protein